MRFYLVFLRHEPFVGSVVVIWFRVCILKLTFIFCLGAHLVPKSDYRYFLLYIKVTVLFFLFCMLRSVFLCCHICFDGIGLFGFFLLNGSLVYYVSW